MEKYMSANSFDENNTSNTGSTSQQKQVFIDEIEGL